MSKCYMLLGTNLGDKVANLNTAIQSISIRIGEIITQSSVYATKAWGKENQEDFLNQVVEVETALNPVSVLEESLNIEQEMGRVRYERWGERLIDIDILYFDQLMIDKKDLVVPHPQLHNRRFTLVPLVEIAPNYIHPKMNVSNEQLLSVCIDPLEVKKS